MEFYSQIEPAKTIGLFQDIHILLSDVLWVASEGNGRKQTDGTCMGLSSGEVHQTADFMKNIRENECRKMWRSVKIDEWLSKKKLTMEGEI